MVMTYHRNGHACSAAAPRGLQIRLCGWSLWGRRIVRNEFDEHWNHEDEPLGGGTPDAYVIMVVADDLAPNGRQVISNHHADLPVTYCDLTVAVLVWIDLNPSMCKQLHPLQNVGWNHLLIPKLRSSSLGMGYAISSHTLLGMWLLIHGGIKGNPRH